MQAAASEADMLFLVHLAAHHADKADEQERLSR